MSFFGGSGSSSSNDAEAYMNRAVAELQQQISQELMRSVAEKCFAKCVSRPGPKLDASEQTCLSRCQERYLEALTIITKAMNDRTSSSSDL
jgi:import inner membrane translocase subunit TIM13